jgi:hypothetical protein
MSFTKNLAMAVTVLILATPAFSGDSLVAVTTAGSDTTKAFVGLNWTFGAGTAAPETILGVVHGSPDAENNLNGSKLAFYFGPGASNGFGLTKVKLSALWGDVYRQGEIGFGYNFGSGSAFAVAGVNAGNFSFGGDFGLAGDFSGFGQVEGYFGIQSIGDFNEATTELMYIYD